jgi:acetyltransferase
MNTTERWHAAGARVQLRPVGPQDAPALGAMYQALPALDRRRRFHGAVNGLSSLTLHRMTCIDPRTEIAFVVTCEDGGESVIAEVRCVIDATGEAAEFALAVALAWRGLGIGGRCMRALQRAAAQRRVRWLHGHVLADNAPMLALMRRCGFVCTASRDDSGLVEVERHLGALPAATAVWRALRQLAFIH